jgi:hypothetical protein
VVPLDGDWKTAFMPEGSTAGALLRAWLGHVGPVEWPQQGTGCHLSPFVHITLLCSHVHR